VNSKGKPIVLLALALAWARRVPVLAGLAREIGDALSFLQVYTAFLCLYPLYRHLIYYPVGKNNLTLHQEKSHVLLGKRSQKR